MQRTTGDTPGPGERRTRTGWRAGTSKPVTSWLAATGLLAATLVTGALAIAATAAEAPGGTVAPASPAAASPAAQGSSAAPARGTSPTARAADADDTAPPPPPANAPRRSPDIFVPTESVPEDRPVAFPVDI
jgi:hypothetical protein